MICRVAKEGRARLCINLFRDAGWDISISLTKKNESSRFYVPTPWPVLQRGVDAFEFPACA